MNELEEIEERPSTKLNKWMVISDTKKKGKLVHYSYYLIYGSDRQCEMWLDSGIDPEQLKEYWKMLIPLFNELREDLLTVNLPDTIRKKWFGE